MNTFSPNHNTRHGERGVTMVFVALAMVAICAVAALSIDVITLYLAREEAQRSADAAALAAARVLSLSGVTGDPNNIQGSLPVAPWPGACALATQTAQGVANQNLIAGTMPNSATVTFVYNGVTADCTAPSASFATNPQVQVKVVRQGLPNFFSRIWNRAGTNVSATATAEAFNSSYSSTAPNGLVTVSPKCVKPWIVPNRDPGNGGAKLVSLPDGNIQTPGIHQSGSGVIGETFTLTADCKTGNPDCKWGGGLGLLNNPPTYNQQGANTLDYVPAFVQGTPVSVPSCANGSAYQEDIGGCDQSTVYACGIVGGGAQVEMTFNPGKPGGETATATQCLIHQAGGQDTLDTATNPFPFQIEAGPGNPMVIAGGLPANSIISSSSSIVTVPIYDDTQAPGQLPTNVNQAPVTIVGFLQVFINHIDGNGNPNVTVLNVAGCSNTATNTTPTVSGSSPVPVRLITPQ
jgi:Flp pilus assembly protein TadG